MTRRYCLCGAAFHGRSSPPATADALAAIFDRLHSGDGCGPTTADVASRARRRDDAALLKATADR